MAIDRTRRITFEEVADLYNEVRPSYPKQLVDDITELSAIPPAGKILEIGCGPGNATILFAERGYPILAVELGERLAEYARARCQNYPGVKVVRSAFEDVELNEANFDLAISADAFHWIVPEIGYPKVFRSLKATGSFAMFGHAPTDPHTEWSEAIARIYHDKAPQLDNPDAAFTLDWMAGVVRESFKVNAGVNDLTIRTYEWTEKVTTDQYIKMLRTYSSHRGIDDALRADLYTAIRNVLHGFGDVVEKPYQVVLFFARRSHVNSVSNYT